MMINIMNASGHQKSELLIPNIGLEILKKYEKKMLIFKRILNTL